MPLWVNATSELASTALATTAAERAIAALTDVGSVSSRGRRERSSSAALTMRDIVATASTA